MQEKSIEIAFPDNSFLFSQRQVIGSFNMEANHFHNQYEIYYLLEGERYYFIKDRVFHIKAGDIVLINQQVLHKTTDAIEKNHQRVLINFSGDLVEFYPYIDDLLPSIFNDYTYVITFPMEGREYIETLLKKMKVEALEKSTSYYVALLYLLIQLLVYIRRNLPTNSSIDLPHPSPIHEKVSEIVQFINHNYTRQLSLDSISKKFFISQYYLSRTFKGVTGFSFIEYLNSVRIREAQKLLHKTNRKIIDISEEVGFRNISHFGRVFKEVTGISPLAYRKLRRK